jgi:dihydroxyacetone kinase DhaKLM complex PTS-EIIA-like component DhaM
MFNLLFLAAEAEKPNIVKYMIKRFDVNFEIDDLIAADVAFETESYESLLVLLHANSQLPAGMDDMSKLPVDVKKFLIISHSMHEAIHLRREEDILDIIRENPNLRHFYDIFNNSAVTFALREKAFDIYKLLVTKNISLGQHESIDEVFRHLTQKQRKQLSDFNIENGQNLAPPHILKLLGNSIVGIDDDQVEARLVHVMKALEKLNSISEIRILLELTAVFENFQLVFDFNRDHVQFLDPRSEAYVNGLFYVNGRIYIAAMHLLDKERAHEVSWS